MGIPVVAIVGRPNVGKSTLFNTLMRRRISIVDPTAGVTRDRVTAICELEGRYVELVDTGGVGIVDRDDLGEHVERQIEFAVGEASLIIFLVDAREGLSALDRRTAELLKRYRERTLLVANKVDEPHMAAQVGEFVRLGFGEPLCISAISGGGRGELTEALLAALPADEGDEPIEPVMKVAIVGKRNAGKSTFINALAGQERMIVSEIPGTTRDSVDVRFEKDGRTLVAIDTAGVRKKSRMVDPIEYYGYERALASIRRADVVMLFVDATEPVGQVDKRLAHLILEERKPCAIVVNKWDLAKGRADTNAYGDYLTKVMPMLDFAPVAFTSAVSGHNVDAAVDLATTLFKQARVRVSTSRLNTVIQDAVAANAPRPKRGNKSPKFLYATQVSVAPPTIVIFVNRPALVTQTYQRFITNRLRSNLPFEEVPIRLLFRARAGEAMV